MAGRSNHWNISFLLFITFLSVTISNAKLNLKHIQGIYETKAFKKLLKTRTNVLVIYSKDDKSAIETVRWTESVAKDIRGKGTVVYINCGEDKESKKLCKKYKASPKPVSLKHYKDGSFHKDYDRKPKAKSLLNFMKDPTGEAPWEEDTSAKDVIHINSEKELIKLRRKERGPILLMFYAPWCGHCKRLKPEFSAAASKAKGKAVLGGLDCDKPELAGVREQFNVTGYPTLIYFEGGEQKFPYGGKYTKDGIMSWLENPSAAEEKPEAAEPEWKDVPSDVVHLTTETFDDTVTNASSVLVMFYAPWCGHCKNMKPEYVQAAKQLKDENVDGILAAVDCTKEQALGQRYDVKGYPTVKYFSKGEEKFKMTERTADKIIDFMKDPKEPPPPPPPEKPWPETSGENILHLEEATFKESLKKRKHVLVMFYAPWCGHCKNAKPEIEEAAAKFADDRKVTFAGIDCTVNQATCETFEVSGYPTFKYFNYGKQKIDYSLGRKANDFVNFMKDPREGPPPPAPEPEWSDTPSKINHLSDETFDAFMENHKSVLVMFYAPWCGHCKSMKPAYADAAEELHNQGASGALAAVDCTKSEVLKNKFKITGFPTIKYFSDGKEVSKYKESRTKESIVKFMLSPKPKAAPSDEWSEDSKYVKTLTTETFDDFAKDKEALLVMFYAPWCGYCKAMKPAFFEAAKVLSETKPKAVLALVDCTAHADVCQRFKIRGYPTLKLIREGKLITDYGGGRGIDDIISFMERDHKEVADKVGINKVKWSDLKSSVVHLSSSDIDSFIKVEQPTLVMFHAPDCETCIKLRNNYMRAASRLSTTNARFAALDCSDNQDYCKLKKIEHFPHVKLYYGIEHEQNVNVDELSTAELIVDVMKKSINSRKEEL